MWAFAFLFLPQALTLRLPNPSLLLETDDCSTLYCQGELLHDVQMSGIYNDSKTFVDKRLLKPADTVLSEYLDLKKKFNGSVPLVELNRFIEGNFGDGEELQEWVPTDWVESPGILKRISDRDLRTWAKNLNIVWKTLSRRIVEDVHKNPDMYSLIFVPNGFVIPGGRFRELYYWDTYWIVNGLLKCDMVKTAKGVIENLASLVTKLGYMPNGNRVYYKGRSQPPMLTLMVDSFYKATKDLSIIKDNVEALDKEMKFWLSKRRIGVPKNGTVYELFHYNVAISRPRPESYKEDVQTVGVLEESTRSNTYKEIRSAAESGWDFSTRWFIKNGTNEGNLSDIATHYIIPVDLNALLHKDFVLLSKMYKMLKNKTMEDHYSQLARKLKTAIDEVLWNEEEGIWLDYDTMNNQSRNYLYLSNFVPLWTQSHSFDKTVLTDQILKYIKSQSLERYIGGVPTSLEYSGEQWDFPNAWPPLQAFLIQGLDRIGTPDASKLALRFAQKWIYSNYKSFVDSGAMFEKYDALKVGQTGGGGEYTPQIGFGWTNGVVYEFLAKWGNQLKAVEVQGQ